MEDSVPASKLSTNRMTVETAEGVVNEVNDSSGSRRPMDWTLLRTVMLRMVPVD
jgi:hypothetical protein